MATVQDDASLIHSSSVITLQFHWTFPHVFRSSGHRFIRASSLPTSTSLNLYILHLYNPFLQEGSAGKLGRSTSTSATNTCNYHIGEYFFTISLITIRRYSDMYIIIISTIFTGFLSNFRQFRIIMMLKPLPLLLLLLLYLDCQHPVPTLYRPTPHVKQKLWLR